MIAKTYILENLRQLESAYRKARTQKHGVFFAKLAILELCGWIEISMDAIIIEHCNRHVTSTANANFIERDIVKRTYGFDYNNHFRKMLISLVGIISCEKVEARIPQAVHVRLVAQLRSLKAVRDSLAHTYLKGSVVTMNIDAPSVTMARFNEIYLGLQAFEQALRSM